ncbi:hypothetical protein P3342_003507 [Pyrenophora teres f. teres]|nr:hypothetical protein P3342_003507 [Pyrenophora teres f. teres]
MSSNNYNQYSYPYQHSSTQQYSAYQTAPASNNVAPAPRQYQQPPTTQAQDYMSYQSQSYANQNNGYGSGQDNSWNGSNYGGTRETTSRAAEVLRNMSNPSYSNNNIAVTNQTGFTAANATASHSGHYGTGNSHSPQVQAQQVQPAYAQSQPRLRSVDTTRTQPASRGLPSPAMMAGYPSQRAQPVYNQQQQRPASPAQPQYNHAPASNARSAVMTATADQHYIDYSGRQLPSVEASCSSQNATSSTAYNYGNAGAIAQPAPTATMADTYSAQSTTTVDPLAVYDPWPEYQRKQAAQKAMEDSQRAEEERIAEEARKIEEQKQEEERKRQEEEDRLRQSQSESKTAQPQPQQQPQQQQQPNAAEIASAAPSGNDAAQALETQIREMMAKMRELNRQDPAMLARIWEEERKAKPKSPTVQSKAPPTATAAAVAVQPIQPAQASTPQATSSKRMSVSKDAVDLHPPKPAAPVAAQAVPVRQPQATASRPTGNTVWPPEKKAHLANAAAVYLNAQNGVRKVEASQVLNMLNRNPSYIELCEQLEHMGLKLDRAAFAKNLLTAVPDVNSASRKSLPQPAPVPAQKAPVPPAVMKKEVATPGAPSPQYRPAAASSVNGASYTSFSDDIPAAPTPVAVAEMVPIKPELRKPANKEEAARKRNLSDLVDLTQLSDEDEMGPPPKRLNTGSLHTYGSPQPYPQDPMHVDQEPAALNFPIAHTPAPAHPPQASIPQPIQPPSELRYTTYVEPLDKKKALRRNTYNPATIARDVLLACGRHPSERNLNQHLDGLRTTLTQITFDADLSTIRWDLIDPGNPPSDYFKNGVQAWTEDADDEDDSEDEKAQAPRAPANAIGEGGAQVRVQALPEAINPFKQKRRGRPPRHSYPDGAGPTTPKRPTNSAPMNSTAPRSSSSAAAGVGYQAFRSATEYGPDGKPLPKKKGRPVGWRKAIHGSAAVQSRTGANGQTGPLSYQPPQPSSLRNVHMGQNNEPIRIDSRSPSVVPQYPVYKCKWQNCKATLHNLETLQKHVFKVHRKETHRNTLECLWDNCGKEVTNFDPMTNMRLERHQPFSFDLESDWRGHLQQNHFSDLSWKLGDGPAGGLSDSHDSEVDSYLSDAQGRQVTPRITVEPERLEALRSSWSPQPSTAAPRGRGRPPKYTAEQEARDAHDRLVSHKKRIGGPGMDRGGVTLVNEKRRRGLIETEETEEELVDAED